MTRTELQHSICVCAAYVHARMEELLHEVEQEDLSLTETSVRQLVDIAKNLMIAAENLYDGGAGSQNVVVRFTDSECKPQDIEVNICGPGT